MTFEQEKTTVHGLCVVFWQGCDIFKKIKESVSDTLSKKWGEGNEKEMIKRAGAGILSGVILAAALSCSLSGCNTVQNQTEHQTEQKQNKKCHRRRREKIRFPASNSDCNIRRQCGRD